MKRTIFLNSEFKWMKLLKMSPLLVTDFSDEEEIEEAKLLWDSLISDLKQVLVSS